MEISLQGVNFIAQFEGWSSKPYLDGGGVPTIGFGTIKYPSGVTVTLKDKAITKQEGLEYLLEHINSKVSKYINTTFKGLNQAQFDSLCSFAYNCGTNALNSSSLKKSILNKGTKEEITTNFMKWNKDNGKIIPGLTRRRSAEALLFNEQKYN